MSLLYLVAPGNISKAFTGIQLAATPERVSQDFVKTVLNIPGSSGDQMTAFLRRLGFSNSDGTPTEIYKQYRNAETSQSAMASAIKKSYPDLSKRNELFFRLADDKLKALIVEVSGEAAASKIAGYMFSTLRNLISLANFDLPAPSFLPTVIAPSSKVEDGETYNKKSEPRSQISLKLGYTINLNLPLNSDIEVFNSIFKSLREHLIDE